MLSATAATAYIAINFNRCKTHYEPTTHKLTNKRKYHNVFFYLLALLHEISKLRVARAIKIIKLKFASRNNFSKCYSSLFCLPLLDFRFPCVCSCGGGFDVITLRLANRTH